MKFIKYNYSEDEVRSAFARKIGRERKGYIYGTDMGRVNGGLLVYFKATKTGRKTTDAIVCGYRNTSLWRFGPRGTRIETIPQGEQRKSIENEFEKQGMMVLGFLE